MALTIVIATLVLLLLLCAVVVSLTINANRRHRHRAELAELRLQRDRELRRVEHEATRHTLTEVGRELHDNVGQLLTVAQMGLNEYLDTATTHPRVLTGLEALDQSVEEVRRLGRSLNQDTWEKRDLLDALDQEAVRLERLGRAHVLLVVKSIPVDPTPDVKLILFRAFQEVIANALRHSRARTITIVVDDRQGFALHITDDGNGFDVNSTQNGSGLDNIRRRCELVNYQAMLHAAPGQGCQWIFKPMEEHAP